MKKILLVALVLLISIAFVSPCFARSKPPPEKAIQEKMALEKTLAPEKAPAVEKVSAPKKRTAKPKVPGFVGTVTKVDASLIDVWGKKAEVAFDTSNPELKGYETIGDVMVGDIVAAEYTKDGIMITKLKGAAGEKTAEKVNKVAPQEKTVRLFTCKGTGPCTVSVDKWTE
jgi:hypothetical protein